jgi:hypothetical protein
MGRTMLIACLPWLVTLLASFLALLLLLRLSRARWDLRRLLRLHNDQVGTVQSLSFVLTLPLFVMIMMLMVQVSQLMIGQIVVEYAAVAAARAAIVWIPAYRVDRNGTDIEKWNCVSGYTEDTTADNQQWSLSGPSDGGMTFMLNQSGDKYQKIRMAAVLACTPISPSRFFASIPPPPVNTLASLESVYEAMMKPEALSNARIRERLTNKLAYAMSEDILGVQVRFYHSNQEPALVHWGQSPADWEYVEGQEVGWQDPITVTVRYKLAMLPGPGRLLGNWQNKWSPPVTGIGGQQGRPSNVYTDSYFYPLYATATLCNEGEKPNYAHFTFSGQQQ